jgi:nicotianamine synthase
VTLLGAGAATVELASTDLCEQILTIFNTLTQTSTLEPGPVVNGMFADLVRICEYRSGENAGVILNDPRITAVTAQLRQLCAVGEFLLERYWARRIIGADTPDDHLAAFPYLPNYQELTTLELHTLAGVGVELTKLRRVCFLGGGPLPLSAMLISQQLSIPVDVIDLSDEATALGREVAQRVSLSAQVHFHQADAADFDSVADSDVVVLAALVGLDRVAKRQVLEALSARMSAGSMLVIRSSHGLRRLLYPPVDLSDLRDWRPLVVARPLNAVVNSVVVAVRR